MATTKLSNGKTIKTTIVGGKTIDSNGNPVPRSMIVSTTGDDGRTWAGDAKVVTPSNNSSKNETETANEQENLYYYGNTGGTGPLINTAGTYGNNNNDYKVPVVPAAAPVQTNYEDIFNKFMEWMTPYTKAPVSSIPTYEETLANLQTQMDPLHQLQEQALERTRNNSIQSLAANLAARGVYNSDINTDETAKILGNYDNSLAALDASYASDLGSKALNTYINAKNTAEQRETAYNQSMVNLGLAMMNGMIDVDQFTTNQAYQNTVLAKMFGENWADMFGIV